MIFHMACYTLIIISQPIALISLIVNTKVVGVLMESKSEYPVHQVGFFSRVTSSWLTPLLEKGYEKPLEMEDLFSLGYRMQAEYLCDRLQRSWNRFKSRREIPSWILFRALSREFGMPFYLAGLLKLAGDIAALATPYVL